MVDQKKEAIQGLRPQQDRPEDQPYTLYESYCEVDLPEYAPTQFKGKALPLPYKVTVDKDSRKVLEVRRFWKEDDPQCMRKKRIVKYPYIEAIGIYGIGLLHILGNSTNALTAAWREALDAGMFASFPGVIYVRAALKQYTNEFRVPPGGGVGVDAPSGRVQDVVMPLPYKDVTPGLMALIDKISEATQRVGGTADLPVGEGKQDAPVGTTLALIEQATKIESAVHKGLHQAQSEEFEIFFELFREDPEAFWRHNPKCKSQWTEEKLLAALENCKLVPVADPNTPSHMHRVAKALAIKQLQAQNPVLYDAKAVDVRILNMIKVADPESLFAQDQGAPQPDPVAMARVMEAQAKQQMAQVAAAKAQGDQQNAAAKLADSQAQRQSDQEIATVNLAKEMIIHGDGQDQLQKQHALAAQQAAQDQASSLNDALLAHASHGLAVRSHEHEASMDRASHGLAVGQHLHEADMARREHGLDTLQAAHEVEMARREHALKVHIANKPEPKPAPKKEK